VGPRATVTVGAAKLTSIPLQGAPGAVRAIGFSLDVPIVVSGAAGGRTLSIPLSVYFDAFVFAVGRGQVLLMTASTQHPFAAAEDARLYSTLVSRALTARAANPAVSS
jgi:hypothetical protein